MKRREALARAQALLAQIRASMPDGQCRICLVWTKGNTCSNCKAMLVSQP